MHFIANSDRSDPSENKTVKNALALLTGTALLLPGLSPATAYAAEEDSVDFQYSHYQEGRREATNRLISNSITGVEKKYPIPNNRNPIEVDSLHGSARISLSDQIKFAFNYTEDTWSGATPIGSAPEQSGAYRARFTQYAPNGAPIPVGASPFVTANKAYIDGKGNYLYQVLDPATGNISYQKDRATHVMSYASPETRKQSDFKLTYDWDEASLSVGGGISTERDYESRFVNLGGRMDFNQKLTTVNIGLSYTNSDISAILDPMGVPYYKPLVHSKFYDQTYYNPVTEQTILNGNRQDWATRLDLTQIINQDALMELGMSYTRSTGFQENPYKLSWFFGVHPDSQLLGLPSGIDLTLGRAFIEQRPDVRNQWNWSARWTQFVEPMDAALHLSYSFAHDDWGINAHTFESDWVQPLGAGWTVIPRVRYYTQDAASFYQTYAKVKLTQVKDELGNSTPTFNLPQNFSSDQRLSGYGTLSGGVTIAKEFAKGVRLETGFEYYTHQGDLKLGGGGEQAFADFDYWVANAALKVNLASLGQMVASGNSAHDHQHGHTNTPAGVMFAHTLEKAGDMMVGYRYMHSQQAGDFLQGDQAVSQQQILANGCPGSVRFDENNTPQFDGNCKLLPKDMTMSMHMLDLMFAPTNWLTLMLMPQFVDMQMALDQPYRDPSEHNHGAHGHESGGVGDTGMYALLNLLDRPHHHTHASLGFTAPTGDVGIRLKERTRDLDAAYVHYGMQLGSGTWDFKPSLTYTGKADNWSWGAQTGGTLRLEDGNKSGYALGDLFETTVWGGYDFTRWLSGTVRIGYTYQDSIAGRYHRNTGRDNSLQPCNKADYIYPDHFDENGIPLGLPIFHQNDYNACLAGIELIKRQFDAEDRPSPMDFPQNYGGQYVDIGFGLSATVPNGALAGNRLAFEWLQPVYTNVNGYQLDRDGALSFTWSYGF